MNSPKKIEKNLMNDKFASTHLPLVKFPPKRFVSFDIYVHSKKAVILPQKTTV